MTTHRQIDCLSPRRRAQYLAACDRYQADKQKPPSRKQASAWLAPIRKAFREIKTGEIDAYRGYAITRIHHADNDFARVDHCINGFLAMLDRLMPDFDTAPLKRVSKKLENGILMAPVEIDDCFIILNACESALIKFKRRDLLSVSQTEMINIELERLGLKEAA